MWEYVFIILVSTKYKAILAVESFRNSSVKFFKVHVVYYL